MRDRFVKALMEIAGSDKNVLLVTGDLGFGVLAPYVEAFPSQFLNAGVAEQNMMGLATGMALEGKTVFVYSIANFPTLRCVEQIRNDACYHNVNVKIVAIGGGFTYGALGISHHATEDLAIMRALPDIRVLAPGDAVETEEAVHAMYGAEGVCYMRLGRGKEPVIHKDCRGLSIGKALEIVDGKDVVIISTGGILSNAHEAALQLRNMGVDAGLYSMPTVKPLDVETIESLAERAGLIVTVEEHSRIGGLGSAVAEVVVGLPRRKAVVKMVALNDCFSSAVGDQEYLRRLYKLTSDHIVEIVVDAGYSR